MKMGDEIPAVRPRRMTPRASPESVRGVVTDWTGEGDHDGAPLPYWYLNWALNSIAVTARWILL